MAKPKHEKTFVDFDKPYETNVIGLRGIIYFGLGLFFLIVITFGLMWLLKDVLEQEAVKTKSSDNPLMLTKEEALPPEPRLQSAPGFGVEDPVKGHVNLELTEPQSEYRELHQQWERLWREGQKDPQTGTVISLSIEEAKRKFLEQNAGTPNSREEEEVLKKSRMIVSDAGAGRNASVRVR
ncbi:MAG: hypothetical protein R2747_08750 [Pyrinomonadaceae bacterium]